MPAKDSFFSGPEHAADFFGGMTSAAVRPGLAAAPPGASLEAAFAGAVTRLSAGGRPLVALSGGLDSSLLLAILAEAGFDPVPYILDDGACNPRELENAFDLCRLLSLEPAVVKIASETLPARFAAAAQAGRGLIINARAVSKFLLFEEAARRGGTLFGGAGADEILFGDPEDASIPPRWFRWWKTRLTFARDLLLPEFRPALPELPCPSGGWADPRPFRLVTETPRLLLPLEKNMPESLGLRAALPFLEPEVVSVALSMGLEELAPPGGPGKRALREIARKRLPEKFYALPKAPVVMPAPGRDDLGREEWAELFSRLLGDDFFDRWPCFDRNRARELVGYYRIAVEPVLSLMEFALMSLCSVAVLS